MRKKSQCGSLIMLAVVWLAIVCTGCNPKKQDEVTGNLEMELSKQMINPEKDTTIKIYTYGGEQHIAKGKLNVIKNGVGEDETILELQGNIKLQESGGKVKPPDAVMERGMPTVLTVYMNEHIYGFYSTHELHVDNTDSGNYIELYGYLEGYSDGNNSYSA